MVRSRGEVGDIDSRHHTIHGKLQYIIIIIIIIIKSMKNIDDVIVEGLITR